ncbi:MAG: prephenate dehydrogenase/arogenate dehydrogenase family protein [Akkermansiaceae bacterium]|nr:prephenate dehydrogenase/arogenate dehydrogenase family protein [Akkermansiaceae bacterium]
MKHPFQNVSILGGGLLGGSLALALKEEARLWARRDETAQKARHLGIAGASSDLSEVSKDCQLLILAVPVGAMADLLKHAIAAGLPEDCLITDVGSVKGLPHQTLLPLVEGSSRHFIGSHPMAGSEQGGIDAAKADLFQGAACLLTNDGNAPAELAEKLEAFWQQIGCRTRWMDAAGHDSLVARISHLPHVLAAAAARTCLETPADGAFGGGGLRDTTRVAGGNVDMWTEILLENKEALMAPLQRSIDDLIQFMRILDAKDQEAARQWLEAAKDRRDSLQ